MLLDALEVSVALVAVVDIGVDLGIDVADLHWVVTGFALGMGATLVVGRRLVRRCGRRRIYVVASCGFALASVVGALATDPSLLVATRVVKGAAAALTAPTGLAILVDAFPAGWRRERAVATYSAFGAWGFSGGLILSGILTGTSWRWAFAFPAVVALVLAVVAWWLIEPDGRGGGPSRGAVPAPGVGSDDRPAVERRRMASAVVGATALNGLYWSALFALSLHLQMDDRWAPWQVGSIFLVSSLGLSLAIPRAARVIVHFGASPLILVGSSFALLGPVCLLWATDGAGRIDVLVVVAGLAAIGVGYMLCFPALHAQAIAAIPPEHRSRTPAVYQAPIQWGGAATMAVSGALLDAGGTAGGPIVAFDAVITLAVVLGLVGLGSALVGLGPYRGPRAGRGADAMRHRPAWSGTPEHRGGPHGPGNSCRQRRDTP